MKNVNQQYKDLKEGKMSKDQFLRNARMSFPELISPITNYNDTISILKAKSILSEDFFAKQIVNEASINTGYSYIELDTEFPVIDLVNPYQLQVGVKFELSKIEDMSGDAYMVALDKALKEISKDPNAYREIQLANYNEVKKEDDKLQMKEVGNKEGSIRETDSSGYLKKVIVKNEKANTSVNKIENKKEQSGVQMMEMPGKEQVLNELKDFLQKKSKLSEDLHYKYTVGQQVLTPKGEGIVTEIVGGTITVKLGDDSIQDFQVNILDKQHDVQHDQTPIDIPEPAVEAPPSTDKDRILEKIKKALSKSENKQEVIKALKEFFSKKKMKEATIFKVGGDVVVKKSGEETTNFRDELTRAGAKFTQSDV